MLTQANLRVLISRLATDLIDVMQLLSLGRSEPLKHNCDSFVTSPNTLIANPNGKVWRIKDLVISMKTPCLKSNSPNHTFITCIKSVKRILILIFFNLSALPQPLQSGESHYNVEMRGGYGTIGDNGVLNVNTGTSR